MPLSEELASLGWNLSEDGINACSEGRENSTAKDVIKQVDFLWIDMFFNLPVTTLYRLWTKISEILAPLVFRRTSTGVR